MNYVTLTIEFFIAGSIIVLARILAANIDPKWAGLIVALPIMTFMAYLLLLQNSTKEVVQKYLLSSIIFMIPAVIFLVSLYVLSKKVNTTTSIAISFMIFATSVFFIQKIL